MGAAGGMIEDFMGEILEFPIFRELKKESVRELLSGGIMHSNKHREILYRHGDAADTFSLVLRGAYKLTKPTTHGDDVIMYFSCPGDVLGALVMPHPKGLYPVSVIAMGPSLVWKIPKRTYMEKWMSNTQVAVQLQNLIYSRMALLQDEKTLQKSPLSRKVAYLLLQLMEKYSLEGQGVLPIPVTRKEIADALGSTVESVIRVMSEWSQSGIVKTNEKHIEILRPGRIVEIFSEKR